jgi:tetratricopeptide (TPR) repeat protein
VRAESRSEPLLVLLARLHRARKTGLVHVLHGETQLVVEVRHGDIAGIEPLPVVAPPAPSEDDSELASLLTDAYLGGEPGLLRAAVRQVLLDALTWTDASCSYIEGTPMEGGDPPLGLSTEELLREAAHSVADPALIQRALGDTDRPLRLEVDPAALGGVPLTPTEGYILSRVDGRLSAREVLQLVPLDSAEAEKSLFGLLLAGLVDYDHRAVPAAPVRPRPRPEPERPPELPRRPEPERPAAPAPTPVTDHAALAELEARRREIYEAHSNLIMNRNHFEVLGLNRYADEAEVKYAYRRLVKRFHPDSYREAGLEDLQGRIQVVLGRLGEAYAVLSNPERRAQYEATLPRHGFNPPRVTRPASARPAIPGDTVPSARGSEPAPAPEEESSYTLTEEDAAFVADEALLRGEQLLAEDKYWDAIKVVEGSDNYMFGKRRQKSRLLLARAYMKNPSARKKSEQLLQSVVQDEPDNADAYFLLGALYKEGGLDTRATSMFRKALELRPGHKQAQEALGAPAPLMKRLFGRA